MNENNRQQNSRTTNPIVPSEPNVVYPCGQKMSVHVGRIVAALDEANMGIGCVGTYRSLLVVAEAIRQFNGWSVYDAGVESADVVAGMRDASAAQLAQMVGRDRSRGAQAMIDLLRAKGLNVEVVDLMDDLDPGSNGPVH